MSRVHLDRPLVAGAEVELPENAHRHLVQVLRLRIGERFTVFDGRGQEAEAVLTAADRRHSRARLGTISRPARESPLAISLLQGVSKGERMDLTLQKAVELGVQRILPLRSERSVVKLDAERWEKKQAHWQGIVVSACEQSGRVCLPQLDPVNDLASALATLPQGMLKLALIPGEGHALRALPPPSAGLALLIGPEGGLSDQEIDQALAAGFAPVQLGPRILRTETAGLATLAAAQALWGDWGPAR
jgi:16S rRNA (uracil1498-N3)-methyltransferase